MDRSIVIGLLVGMWTLVVYWFGFLMGRVTSDLDHTIKTIDEALDRIGTVKKSG